ncbi:MAG: phenylalanine--tRNA ligase subunit beta [Candidatus Goldiibacteriota bacterium HGW-Goldbacteria-1]|jgi:phenylalanyl-tRNA synthetase beta chain|nr:MAG: phenylalanine--tRNA ligase subunit beta [Candidatus Goldiibacteriota bacterium HGW-Goldbacteria-1]
MLASYNWIKEYIDINIPSDEFASKLYMSGLACEEIIEKKAEISNVVAAKILKIDKHPNADKLAYCDVTDGTQTYKVVCGAPNIKEGQTVPLARLGATLPGGVTIKRSKIRGIESEGMMCSGRELGFGDDHSGIMLLDETKYPLGTEFSPVKADTVFNFEITPNRPDLLCITGIARLASAVYKKPVKMPSWTLQDANIDPKLDINSMLQVENQSPERCPRYAARIIKDVTVKDSPEWLKEKLISAGVRPINNIVDVTNFVLLELNQPLHAFDYARLKGSKIIIRTAKKGEKITALDGKTYEPKETDLMIADSTEPAAIAGVMGGEHFSVTSSTTTVVLESACFNPGSVRKTSRSLAIKSDSSYRFERGIDIDNTINALNRAVNLIIETSGGKASSGIIDIYPVKILPKEVKVRFETLARIIGIPFTPDAAAAIIKDLGFTVTQKDNASMTVSIPGYRVDIEKEIDVIEDIAQIYGYDNIPMTMPLTPVTIGTSPGLQQFISKARSTMTSFGYSQAVNYSFMNKKLLKELKAEAYSHPSPAAIANPFNEEESHMKATMIPDMIKNLIFNYNKENENIHLFETANTFSRPLEGNYTQTPHLSAVSYGDIMETSFSGKSLKTDLYYVKSAVSGLTALLNTDAIPEYAQDSTYPEFMEYSAGIFILNKRVGTIGQLKEEIAYDNKLKEKAYLLEINLEELYSLYKPIKRFTKLSAYPSVKRDLALIIKNDIAHSAVENIIKDGRQSLIKSINLFDIYKGKQVPDGCKSLAYNIIFQSNKRTLSETEINKVMETIIDRLKKEINAELRS